MATRAEPGTGSDCGFAPQVGAGERLIIFYLGWEPYSSIVKLASKMLISTCRHMTDKFGFGFTVASLFIEFSGWPLFYVLAPTGPKMRRDNFKNGHHRNSARIGNGNIHCHRIARQFRATSIRPQQLQLKVQARENHQSYALAPMEQLGKENSKRTLEPHRVKLLWCFFH